MPKTLNAKPTKRSRAEAEAKKRTKTKTRAKTETETETEPQGTPPVPLRPAQEKVGEPRGNLAARARAFTRRTGGAA